MGRTEKRSHPGKWCGALVRPNVHSNGGEQMKLLKDGPKHGYFDGLRAAIAGTYAQRRTHRRISGSSMQAWTFGSKKERCTFGPTKERKEADGCLQGKRPC